MSLLIDGPRLPPRNGAKADALVILLHGYGSNGDDLIGLAPYFAPLLPGTAFIAPDAPEPIPGYPGGRQWFALDRMDPERLSRGADAAAPGLNRFLDREMERAGLPAGRVAVVGFSQGTMMALHVSLRRRDAFAAVLGYSGALVAPNRLKAEMTARPPVLLVHGDRDDMVPVQALFAATEALAAAGHGAEFHVSPGLGHSIGQDGLDIGGAFLRAALKAA